MGTCTMCSKESRNSSGTVICPEPTLIRSSKTNDPGTFRNLIIEEDKVTGQRKFKPKSRKVINLAEDVPDSDARSARVTNPPRTAEETHLIKTALQNHFIFNSLPAENLSEIMKDLKLFTLKDAETVFSQGDPAHQFFIVSKGRVEVIVNGKSKGYLGRGTGFGELALVHNSGRTATIRTVGPTELWGIHRSVFRTALKLINLKFFAETKQFIESIPLFAVLTPEQKEILASMVVTQEFKDGQKVVVEGDPGDTCYIIKEGSVVCTRRGVEIRTMGPGDFFGEQALLYSVERTATVTSVRGSVLLSIGRNCLTEALGDQIQRIVYRNSLKIALERSAILTTLTPSQVDRVTEHFELKQFAEGQTIVNKGEEAGNGLWIVLNGRVRNSNRELQVLECIGDKQLLSEESTIYEDDYLADTPADLGHISKTHLAEALGDTLQDILARNALVKVLRSVELFRTLPMRTIEQLSRSVQVQEFQDLDVIFDQDDPGDAFYIVRTGQVEIFINGNWVRTIQPLGYFGERSILLNEKRTAAVIAKHAVSCWVLSKDDFLRLVEEAVRDQLEKRLALQNDKVKLDDLEYVDLLGKGMFGIVLLTVTKQQHYALKTVSKHKIGAYDLQESLSAERKLLLQLDHPMIMKLVKTFKDPRRVYFLTEYVRGSDMFDVIRVLNILSIADARFYTSCLLLILEHLHEKRIVYRDLKPENIIVDEFGYPKLIDFGTAKQINGRTFTIVGTPHYMAPEVIMGKGYDTSADYWSLGVMVYEFVCGIVPFAEDEEDTSRVYQCVLQNQLKFPAGIRTDSRIAQFIQKLLNRSPALRGNSEILKEHRWLRSMDWTRLLTKQLEPPYKPPIQPLPSAKKTVSIFDVINKEEVSENTPCRPMDLGDWDDEF